jgi:hypothetical protein
LVVLRVTLGATARALPVPKRAIATTADWKVQRSMVYLNDKQGLKISSDSSHEAASQAMTRAPHFIAVVLGSSLPTDAVVGIGG